MQEIEERLNIPHNLKTYSVTQALFFSIRKRVMFLIKHDIKLSVAASFCAIVPTTSLTPV